MTQTKHIRYNALTVAAVLFGLAFADESSRLKPQASSLFPSGSRVVFLGDSITFDGRYTHYFQAYVLTRYPDRDIDFINVGLPSEGVTGLSEPAHPFPRPNVHERLGRVLEQLKSDLVIACYGMNDGIYHPFSEERFDAYNRGIDKLIADVTGSGAKIILITPPPFDAVPIADKTRPADAEEFSWMHPYRAYDSVMEKYSAWLLAMDDPRVSRVVDARTPTLRHLEAHRRDDAGYALAPDGVHTNAVGQRIIAQALVSELFGEGAADLEGFDADANAARLLAVVRQRQELIGRAWMTHIGHKRPSTPAGPPLDRASAQAEELHRKARELAKPVMLKLWLDPVK